MELVVALGGLASIVISLLALDLAAMRWGVDSRAGLCNSVERQSEWHIWG